GRVFEPKAAVPAPGSADLCFLTTAPLDAVMAHLQDCGAAVVEGPVLRTGATGTIRSVYVRDPDGNLIEIANSCRICELDLVVFDMAGTTVQDDGQVATAFTAALAEHGLTVGPDAIRAVRGASKRQAILDLLPPGSGSVERADQVYASFRDHLAHAYA